MSVKSELISALEDAGYENPKVKWQWTNPRGWYVEVDEAGAWEYLGAKGEDALKVIHLMPNPNKIEQVSVPKATAPEEVSIPDEPEKFDDFGNLVDSSFGHR